MQRELTITCTIKEWSADAVQNLQGFLDWDILVNSASDVNELTESVFGSVELCVNCTIPKKTVKKKKNPTNKS